ncbi:MAG: histidine phosphatase family protein [Verrucomicrobia bacterium]|nr:histidine phosphatase family protein [Verrucomicrobiota bacterium]
MIVVLHRNLHVAILSILVTAWIGCTEAASAGKQSGLHIYYLRHAETVANTSAVYTFKNESRFSPAGQKQVESVSGLLSDYEFDSIITSPTFRTRKTILPYLKEKGMTAVIWPEAEECCWHSDRTTPAGDEIDFRNRILLDEDEAPFFTFRDDKADCWIKLSNYNDGMQIVERTHELILQQYGGKDVTILIVGHQLSGSRLIELLLGLEPVGRFRIENASLSHLKQNRDGTFELLGLSGNEYHETSDR